MFSNIFLRTSRNRFAKAFRPTKLHRNSELLVHAGENQVHFVKAVPIIHMIKRTGNITLIASSSCKDLTDILNAHFTKIIFYDKPLKVMNSEHDQITKVLVNKKFDFIFDLGNPANISIPYLTKVNQRVCVGGRDSLPYFNIVFENTDALIDYFRLKPTSSRLFTFSKSRIKEIRKKYNLISNYVIVNKPIDLKSEHRQLTIGKDINIKNPDLYALILSSQGYYGDKDHFAEFARLHNIKLLMDNQ